MIPRVYFYEMMFFFCEMIRRMYFYKKYIFYCIKLFLVCHFNCYAYDYNKFSILSD